MNRETILNGLNLLSKYAALSNKEIVDSAAQYYDDNDPRDVKRRWSHVLEALELAKRIRGRELTPMETAMISYHDTAYRDYGPKKHGLNGSRIFRRDGSKLGFNKDEINQIAKRIQYHQNYPRSNSSPLYKDDLQLLMFAADEGKPVPRRDTFKRQLRKALSGWYPELQGIDNNGIPEALANRIRKQPHNLKRFQYYDKIYPGYSQSINDYIYSDDIVKDFKDLIEKGDVTRV